MISNAKAPGDPCTRYPLKTLSSCLIIYTRMLIKTPFHNDTCLYHMTLMHPIFRIISLRWQSNPNTNLINFKNGILKKYDALSRFQLSFHEYISRLNVKLQTSYSEGSMGYTTLKWFSLMLNNVLTDRYLRCNGFPQNKVQTSRAMNEALRCHSLHPE